MPFATVGDYRIRYRLTGEPSALPPLVLIHGAGGGQYVWTEQRRLDVGRQLLTLDLPGHGQSTPEPAAVTIEEYAEVVTQLAEMLAVDRFVPVGHSMGGAVAQILALDHADRVDALVLAATGARLPTADFVFEAIRSSFGSFATLLAATAYAPGTPAELVRRLTSGPLQASQRIVLGDFTACNRFDVRARLSEIAVPTLILAAAEDRLMGAGRARQLETGIADSRLIVVEGAGHMLMQEQPEAFGNAVKAFCEELRER
ncbi:MAG: alpha/beta hydrolase [bacterium]